MKPTIIREDFARAKARIILKEQGLLFPPTNLDGIFKSMKIKTHYCLDFNLEESFMFLYKGQYHVVVAPSGYYPRDRWSAAHELGHVVLGHCDLYEVDKLTCNRLSNRERYILDREADTFAEELLMPSKWMRKYKSLKLTELTNIFNVSKEAMTIRLSKIS